MQFYSLVNKITPWFGWSAGILFIAGIYGAFFYAPADYQQGESFRIIYVHVPSAWMSMFIYMVMATSGALGLIWKTKVSDAIARACAPLAAVNTWWPSRSSTRRVEVRTSSWSSTTRMVEPEGGRISRLRAI